MEHTIQNISELSDTVKQLLEAAGDRKIWLFTGEIGAGKTTFIKEFCSQLGVTDHVVSPTYSLINEYHSDENGTVRHLDLYRLKKLEEAIDIGIEEFLYDNEYCLIEWPALIDPILPDDCFRISIEITKNNARKFIFA